MKDVHVEYEKKEEVEETEREKTRNKLKRKCSHLSDLWTTNITTICIGLILIRYCNNGLC